MRCGDMCLWSHLAVGLPCSVRKMLAIATVAYCIGGMVATTFRASRAIDGWPRITWACMICMTCMTCMTCAWRRINCPCWAL
eukprot:411334-Pelagomonas_calceolata.AAC.1